MKGPSSSPKVTKVSIKASKLTQSQRLDPPTPKASAVPETKAKNSDIVDRIYLRAESPIKQNSSLRISDASKALDTSSVEKRIQIDTTHEIEFKGNLAGLRVVVSSPPPKSVLVESTIDISSPPKPKREAVSVPPKPTAQRDAAVKPQSELIGIKVFEEGAKSGPKSDKVAFDFRSKPSTKSTLQLHKNSDIASKTDLKGILKSNSKSLAHESPQSKNKNIDETARKVPPPHATKVNDKLVNTSSQKLLEDTLKTAKAPKKQVVVKSKSQRSGLRTNEFRDVAETSPPKNLSGKTKNPEVLSVVSSRQELILRSPPKSNHPAILSQTLPTTSQQAKSTKISTVKSNKSSLASKTLPNNAKLTLNQTMTSTSRPSKNSTNNDRQWKEKSLQQQAITKEKLKRDRILKEIDREELLHAKLLEKLDAQINRTGSEMERLHNLKSQTKKYLDEIARLKSNKPPLEDLSEVFEKTSQRSVARSPSARLLRSPNWANKSQKADLDQSIARSVDLLSVHSRSHSEINKRHSNSRSASAKRSKSTNKPAVVISKKDRSSQRLSNTVTDVRKAPTTVPASKQHSASLKTTSQQKPSKSKSPATKANIFERGSAGSKSSGSFAHAKTFYQPRDSQTQEQMLLEGDFQTLGRNAPVSVGQKPVLQLGQTQVQGQGQGHKHKQTRDRHKEPAEEEEYRLARSSTDKKPSAAMRTALTQAVRQLRPVGVRESTALLQQIYAPKRPRHREKG